MIFQPINDFLKIFPTNILAKQMLVEKLPLFLFFSVPYFLVLSSPTVFSLSNGEPKNQSFTFRFESLIPTLPWDFVIKRRCDYWLHVYVLALSKRVILNVSPSSLTSSIGSQWGLFEWGTAYIWAMYKLVPVALIISCSSCSLPEYTNDYIFVTSVNLQLEDYLKSIQSLNVILCLFMCFLTSIRWKCTYRQGDKLVNEITIFFL